MDPAAGDGTTVLVDRTSEAYSSINDAHPYILAIDRIQVAITRHRTNKESLVEATFNAADGLIEDSRRSQSPVGFTNDAQTIEEIEGILKELERNYKVPPPKLSHDSSQIEEDLVSAADDNGQVTAPPQLIEAPWPIQEVTKHRTHPENFEPYGHHIDEIGIFENDLMKAFNNSKTAEIKYSQVEVLLITWEALDGDDIQEEVEADTQELIKLFTEVNYTITSYAIPRDPTKCQTKLLGQLLKFVEKYEEYPADDVLFLVHYNGHGSIRKRKSYWHPTGFAARLSDRLDPNSEPNGPTIEYDDVRKIFDSVKNQDILFVFDCCYAGAASRSKGPGNTKELLAACGSDDTTPATPSFTSRFVKCFRDQLKTDSVFQVGWLFESITDISQKPTPLHVNLNKSPTSICLSSLASSEPEPLAITTSDLSKDSLSPGGLLGLGSPTSATSSKALSTFSDDNDISDGYTRPTSTQGGPAPDHWNYEVLITVKLHGDLLPNKKGWHLEYPTNQVKGVESVKVRSVAGSKSTLLLVTMPIRYWILLPDNPAYTFIDFVKIDTYVTLPEGRQDPQPIPSPAIGQVERSDSGDRNKGLDNSPHLHIIAAIKDFFDNKPSMKEKSGPIRRISSKIGLHSSRFESDPRYGYIRHIMQQFDVLPNEHGGSHIRYNLQFTEEKRLFEKCKESVKKVLNDASLNNKNELESTVTAELNLLEEEVLELVKVEKKRPKIEPRAPSSDIAKSKAQSQHRQHTSISQVSKHEAIPEGREIKGSGSLRMNSRTGSGNISSGIPRTDSTLSMKRLPRTDSIQSRSGIPRSDSKTFLSYLGRKISRDSGRTSSPVTSPLQSPRLSGHLSYPGIQTSS